MLKTLREFIVRCEKLDQIADAFDVFEYECSDQLRDTIYSFADARSPEPFRAAMWKLGYTDF